MRWSEHLILGSIVGMLAVAIWEIYTGNNLGKIIIEASGGTDVGMILAVLLVIIIIVWGIASQG